MRGIVLSGGTAAFSGMALVCVCAMCAVRCDLVGAQLAHSCHAGRAGRPVCACWRWACLPASPGAWMRPSSSTSLPQHRRATLHTRRPSQTSRRAEHRAEVPRSRPSQRAWVVCPAPRSASSLAVTARPAWSHPASFAALVAHSAALRALGDFSRCVAPARSMCPSCRPSGIVSASVATADRSIVVGTLSPVQTTPTGRVATGSTKAFCFGTSKTKLF